MSESTKNILIGAAVITVLAIAVVATAGVAGVGIGAAFSAGFAGAAIGSGASGLAVTVAAGAFAGAVSGAIATGVIGGVIGGTSAAINNNSIGNGIYSGFSNGFKIGAITGAAMGGLRGALAFRSSTPMFRAMSSSEVNSIKSSSGFSSSSGSFESKWFFANRSNAVQFGNNMYGAGNYSITGIRVSTSALSSSSVYYTPFIDYGPGYCFGDLGALNGSISGIWFP